MESDPLNKESLESSGHYPDFPIHRIHRSAERAASCQCLTSRRWIRWLLCTSFLLNLFAASAVLWIMGFARTDFSSDCEHKLDILSSFDETDLRYQSLDSRYDGLWNSQFSMANRSGILDLPDSEHRDGFQKLGGLAM
jgi:hypothetical protein